MAACFIRVTQVTPWNLVPDSINPAPSRPSCDTLFLLMAITWGPRAGRRCKLAEQVIQITNYGTAAGGKASGLQTFLLGPALRAKLQVVSDFRHTRGEILSLLVKDEEKQMTRLLHLFKPLFAWEHPSLKSCHIFNLPRCKLLLGATLNTVVTFPILL